MRPNSLSQKTRTLPNNLCAASFINTRRPSVSCITTPSPMVAKTACNRAVTVWAFFARATNSRLAARKAVIWSGSGLPFVLFCLRFSPRYKRPKKLSVADPNSSTVRNKLRTSRSRASPSSSGDSARSLYIMDFGPYSLNRLFFSGAGGVGGLSGVLTGIDGPAGAPSPGCTGDGVELGVGTVAGIGVAEGAAVAGGAAGVAGLTGGVIGIAGEAGAPDAG